MKVTTSYIKQLVKEEVNKTLGEMLYTTPERFPNESEEDFKNRKKSDIMAGSEFNKKQAKLSQYKPSKAAEYALTVLKQAAEELGFYPEYQLDGAKLDSNGNVYQKLTMEDQTIALIYEPLDNERVLSVRVAARIKGLKEKMKEIMGSNPDFEIRFI